MTHSEVQYIEFVAITRHILQLNADSENEVLEAANEVAKTGSCSNLLMLDSANPLIFHPPYMSPDFGPMDDGGPVFFYGSPFGNSTKWMRDTATKLIKLADQIDSNSSL